MKKSERFKLGVNYWPRHHGVRMWPEWKPEEIDSEFREIAGLGMDTVRVFLTWDDFQPLKEVGAYWAVRDIVMRHDENITPQNCPEMIDERMVEKFDRLLAIARKHKLKLIVALMTGWMSGTLLDVAWRKGRSIWTDSFMLKWQLLYCRYFAGRYRDNETILAWEMGNEHNCFMPCENPDAAWSWMRSMVNQIRVEDNRHPIFSGMHSLAARVGGEQRRPWGIRENAQNFDWLTVHPYPVFTPGCYLERITDFRANLHASAESRYYACLGGKPVLCEETGSLGDTIACEESAADFIRLRLHSLLANNDRGCLWWCFSDFSRNELIPYRWVQMENDGLGLTSIAGRRKPAAEEFRKFSRVLDELGGSLPPAEKRAAIVLIEEENDWELYYNTWVLCKQAGIEADFIYPHSSFEPYRLLICPSVAGHRAYQAGDWSRMQDFAAQGGVLYFSSGGASVTNLPAFFGIRAQERVPFPPDRSIRLNPAAEAPKCFRGRVFQYASKPDWCFEFQAGKAGVLLEWADDRRPAMLENRFGRGTVLFLDAPVEKLVSRTPYALEKDQTHLIYRYLRDLAGIAAPLDIFDPQLERTYHPVSRSEGYLVLVNHRRKALKAVLEAEKKPALVKPLKGCPEGSAKKAGADWRIELAGLHAAIFRVRW